MSHNDFCRYLIKEKKTIHPESNKPVLSPPPLVQISMSMNVRWLIRLFLFFQRKQMSGETPEFVHSRSKRYHPYDTALFFLQHFFFPDHARKKKVKPFFFW